MSETGEQKKPASTEKKHPPTDAEIEMMNSLMQTIDQLKKEVERIQKHGAQFIHSNSIR
jgi:hypothetical protein